MKIAVSSYSFSQCIAAGKMTQLDCVRKAAEMGFEGIDFTELKPNDKCTLDDQKAYAAQIREEAARWGIAVVACTIGANLYRTSDEENRAEVERVKSQLDVAAIMGARILRHDVCYGEKTGGVVTGFDKMLPTIAKNAREISEYARGLGIKTCSENHGFVAQDSDRVEKLLAAVDHDNYGLLIDVGNFACVDEDSVKAVSRLANYAVHVHAKDFVKKAFGTPDVEGERYLTTRGCNKLVACAIGDGDIPVAQCMAILRRAGYDGYVTIEFEGAEDCLQAIARGRENLMRYLGR